MRAGGQPLQHRMRDQALDRPLEPGIVEPGDVQCAQRRFQPERRREHRQLAQRRLLGGRQQGEAPVQRGTQAAVPWRHGAAIVMAQGVQPPAEARMQRCGAEHRQPCRGQLQRQRHAVERAHQRCDVRPVGS